MKKKISRNIITVCFVMLLFLSVFAVNGLAADDEIVTGSCGENVTYELNKTTGILTISGEGAIADYSSGESPFYGYSGGITDIVITDGVTGVGANAFYNCTALQSLAIPEGITRIENRAFSSCSGLTAVSFPESLTYIGDYAFNGCTALTSVAIPAGVNHIGSTPFYYDSQLEGITVDSDNAVYYSEGNCLIDKTEKKLIQGCNNSTIAADSGIICIGDNAFCGCSELISITIPDTVTSIGNDAFYNCSGLMSVSLPESLTTIEGSAFQNCESLTAITIPAGVKIIESSAFRGCDSLAVVELCAGVEEIHDWAFAMCRGLKNIVIPETTKYIGKGAFMLMDYLICHTTNLIIVIKNRNCEIDDLAFTYDDIIGTITRTKTIIGYPSSTAYDYAAKHSLTSFVPIFESVAEVQNEMIAGNTDFYFYYDKDDEINNETIFRHDHAQPQSGDYMRFNIDGAFVCEKDNDIGLYHMTGTCHTTAEQEQLITEFVNEWYAANKTALDADTEEEKARLIYDYLCDNIAVPAEDSEAEMFDAWYALIHNEAYCQGFALAFYRLALVAGLDARIVVNGSDSKILHAWNIVKIGENWYSLDASAGSADKNLETLFTEYFGVPMNAAWKETVRDAFFLKPLGNGYDSDYSVLYGENYTAPEIKTYQFPDADDAHYTVGGTVGSLQWKMDLYTGTLTITGDGVLPDFDGNDPAPWLMYSLATGLKNIVIGNGVTAVGEYAFFGCPDIGTVYLPGSLTDISGTAFDCENVTVHCAEGTAAASFAEKNGYTVHTVTEYNNKEVSVCGADNLAAYAFCDVCEDSVYFTDNGIYKGSGHKTAVIPALAATCSASGYTESTYCPVCGTVFIEAEEIPATGIHPDMDEDNHCDICGKQIAEEQDEAFFVSIQRFFRQFLNAIVRFLNLFLTIFGKKN